MLFKRDQLAIDQSQPLPHSIPGDKTAIEDRNRRQMSGHKRAIHIHQHSIISWVGLIPLSASLRSTAFISSHTLEPSSIELSFASTLSAPASPGKRMVMS